MTKVDDFTVVRDQILVATLAHVAFDGWSFKSVEAGAIDSGKELGWGSEMARRAFPDGIHDLIGHLADWTDRRMLHELAKLDLDSMRIRDRISTCICLRLKILAPYREGLRRLLSYLALPQNTMQAARLTWAIADTIWYAAGDQSSDYNYYTKRGLLASVYSTTVLYWLADESDGFVDTLSYLDRRIANVMKIPVATSRIKKSLYFLPGLLASLRNAKS
jgi:ubiquinone biosynthesis protein COQ9